MLRSEDHFLEIVDSLFPNTHPQMAVGRGDDCAVIECPGRLCVSSDLFLEDVHFRTRYFSPEDIGYKALASNLSDLAANGADPLGFNLCLIWPEYLDQEYCRRMLGSMAELAGEFDLALTGGDLSFGTSLGLSISLWGEAPAKSMLRSQAKPGDILFVVGEIGMARAGLVLLEEDQPEKEHYPGCVQQHLRPFPLVREGRLMADLEGIKGAMDVSDGLARDLPRFLSSGTGVKLAPGVELHPEILGFCRQRQLDPLDFVLRGGEDYALLGACEPQAWERIAARISLTRYLGRVTDSPGIFLEGRKLSLKGFDHFEREEL